MQKRQGDLLIIDVKSLPQKVRLLSGRVLAEGEATGHKHQLDVGMLFETPNGKLFFSTKKTATLKHEEHASLTFLPGVYEVRRQREYEPDGWREVAD